MGRQGKGTVLERAGKFSLQVKIGDARKTLQAPTCTSKEEAKDRAAIVSTHVARLEGAGQGALAEKIAEKGASLPADKLPALATLVDGICKGTEKAAVRRVDAAGVTFKTFAARWTSGELHTLYPDHVREKRSVQDDVYRLKKINDVVGDIPMVSFTLEHAEEVMSELPDGLEPAARRHYAQILSRLMNLATYPAKIIPASPLPRGWLPRVPQTKQKQVLWPDEEAKAAGSPKVPIHYRTVNAFLGRVGLRLDEAFGLDLADVDLVHGVVSLPENKTDDPRLVPLEPDVVAALKVWKATYRARAAAGSPFFVRPDGERHKVDGYAARYREHLLAAGVDRAELHARTKTRLALRAHDTRAFFCTYALAAGRSESWVMDRTGHRSSQMVQRYRRLARTVADLGLPSPAPMTVAVPELGGGICSKNGVRSAADVLAEVGEFAATVRNRESKGLIAQSVELRTFNPSSPVADPSELPSSLEETPNQVSSETPPETGPLQASCKSVDVDETLAQALAGATAAGAWDVVARIVDELRARRLAEAGNVVDFDLARKRGGR